MSLVALVPPESAIAPATCISLVDFAALLSIFFITNALIKALAPSACDINAASLYDEPAWYASSALLPSDVTADAIAPHGPGIFCNNAAPTESSIAIIPLLKSSLRVISVLVKLSTTASFNSPTKLVPTNEETRFFPVDWILSKGVAFSSPNTFFHTHLAPSPGRKTNSDVACIVQSRVCSIGWSPPITAE